MNIKVKATAAKEASVSIVLDVESARRFSEFLGYAVNNKEIVIDTAEAFGDSEVSVLTLISEVISGLDGGAA